MKRYLNYLTFTLALLCPATYLSAQVKLNTDIKTIRKENFKLSEADSLYHEIDNFIFGTFYTPSYMSTKISTFSILKVDIAWGGKVTDIRFSDSADSTFVKAWNDKLKTYDIKATFEKYAKAKSYEYVSLLIPISFEPQQPNSDKHYTNGYLESYLKFDKRPFEGKAIMLSPIFITVLSKGNM
jgi:hypothetical protein